MLYLVATFKSIGFYIFQLFSQSKRGSIQESAVITAEHIELKVTATTR